MHFINQGKFNLIMKKWGKTMKNTINTFEIIDNLRIFPNALVAMIVGYTERYDVSRAKEIYKKACEIEMGSDTLYFSVSLGWHVFCTKPDSYLFSIFALSLHALQAEEDFNCEFWNEEKKGIGHNPNQDVQSDPLEMLEIILVGQFGSKCNLMSYIKNYDGHLKNTPKWEKFKKVALASLSLIFAAVNINSKFIQLVEKENLKKGYSGKNLDDTLTYFLESKTSVSQTRYFRSSDGNYGNKHHLFALTYDQSQKLKKVCDLYCKNHEQFKVMKLNIICALKDLFFYNEDYRRNDFPKTQRSEIALSALIKSIEGTDSVSSIKALLQSGLSNPDLQSNSFNSTLKEIEEFFDFSDLPLIEDSLSGITL